MAPEFSFPAAHDDGCDCAECLRRRNQEQARTLSGTAEARPSRADERLLAEEARQRDARRAADLEAERLAAEAEWRAELERKVAHVARAVEALSDFLAEDRSSELRAIKDHARRMRGHLERLPRQRTLRGPVSGH